MSEMNDLKHPEVAAWDLERIYDEAIKRSAVVHPPASVLKAGMRRIMSPDVLDYAYGCEGGWRTEEDVIEYLVKKLKARFP